MPRHAVLVIVFALSCVPVSAQAPGPASPSTRPVPSTQAAQPSPGARALAEMFDFVLGQWQGEASGSPGEGTGSFTFERSLDGNLVTRHSRTEFPATKERAATDHRDFMAIYAEGGQVRADYVDNESHVIHYTVSYAAESTTLIFVSPIVEGQPRFRLTYRPLSQDRIEVAFEMAPPGKPTAFAPYVKGVSRRVK